jgi:hypothetical protein
MAQINLFCISDEELGAEVSALSPADRAALDALPSGFALEAPEPLPAPAPAIPKTDARRLEYSGPWPRKRHYHRCPECKGQGSNGVNCYKARCSKPVLLSGPCSWCRRVVAPAPAPSAAAAWRVGAYGD